VDGVGVDIAGVRAISLDGSNECCLGGVEDEVGDCVGWTNWWSCLVKSDGTEAAERSKAFVVVD